MTENVFGSRIVNVGNRIMIHDRYHKVRIFSQPSWNTLLPSVFESEIYKIYAYKQIENKLVVLDNNNNLLTLNPLTGKVIKGFKISSKLLSPKAKKPE